MLAREKYLAENCQGLIGFGGGSAIDCAKAVGTRIARPRLTIPKMKGILKIWLPIPYLIAVPTTAGTGSETTLATVITDHNTSHKFPISDFPLIPRVAVLDPLMTRTLPQHMTSTNGMDALTHAIEAYIGRSTTKQTRAAALEAARLIAENLETAYNEGDNMEIIDLEEGVDPCDAKAAADYLWAHTAVLEEYLAAAELPEEYAQIVAGWKRCMPGRYILERHLKKGSVFLSAEDGTVYMVKGLCSTWEEMLGEAPVLLDAVLIPFRDSIISDGLVVPYRIYFGKGARADFKDAYMTAKKNQTIRFTI